MKYKKNTLKSRPFAISAKIILWFASGLIVATQVFFTIGTATSGAKLAKLEKMEDYLVKENQELSDGLVKSTSLSSLSATAESLGFIKPSKTLYISAEETVAKAP